MRFLVKKIALKVPILKKAYRDYLINSNRIESKKNHTEFLKIAEGVYLNEKNDTSKLLVGLVKDHATIENEIPGYVLKINSYMKYERFLKNNHIRYEYYDIYKNDWIEKAKRFNIIIWHTNSTPAEIYIAESKIYILEKVLHIHCFPSFHEIWQYEDKNRSAYLYETLLIPSIPTFVSHSKKESLLYAKNVNYPVILKTFIGASSSGVVMVKNKHSLNKHIHKAFGHRGCKTIFPYFRLKNTVYIQKFIADATFDLRIIIVGEKLFGYYRYPPKGDFRASGAGIYEKKELPDEAMRLAVSIKKKLASRLLGIDLLYSQKSLQYYVIETSLFNQIDTAEQLVINGVPGYYDISNDEIVFKEGRYWIQELVLQLVIEQWYSDMK